MPEKKSASAAKSVTKASARPQLNDTQKIEKQLQKQTKLLEEIAGRNSIPQTMLRGVTQGLFTALGATIGFALVLSLTANFLSSVSTWPLVDEFLQQTRLDQIIERQLQEVDPSTQEEQAPVETVVE